MKRRENQTEILRQHATITLKRERRVIESHHTNITRLSRLGRIRYALHDLA